MSETTEKAKHFIVQNTFNSLTEPVSEYSGPSLYKYIGINATPKNLENDFFVESANLKKDLRNFDSIRDKKAWFSKYVLLNDPFEMSLYHTHARFLLHHVTPRPFNWSFNNIFYNKKLDQYPLKITVSGINLASIDYKAHYVPFGGLLNFFSILAIFGIATHSSPHAVNVTSYTK